MYYNTYNENLSDQLNKIYNNFNKNNLKDYYELLKLIYQIYYNENIFLLIDKNIKYRLNTILTLIIRKNNFFIINNPNNIIENFQSFICIINQTITFDNNFKINYSLKTVFQQILNDKFTIYENVFKKINNVFSNENIKKFFEEYEVDFTKEILNIKDVKIPNFSLYNKNKMIDHYYEFYHLLFKIYAPLLFYGSIFQEGYEYQITEKDIIFDCGGNMGLFALYCASKGAQVYCFEPMSYIRSFLYESQKLYSNNIHIIPYGVSDKEEDCYFQQGYNPGASKNNLFSELITSPEVYKEKCKLITLDDFSQQYNIIPTFIKADIEGSENKMLIGAKNLIQNYQPILHICLNHRMLDQYTLPSLIHQINPNYSYYFMKEGEEQSKFVLCK